ncbi:branched-chain amino acid ABC transporter permease [Polynucleobacter sp. Adler-ghost]|uniref:branched-chain amino acid ABC transporter permease n=1 Tax=Polynucleobacter sp. Adler-ghost TaxID=2770234 RepID=UPI001BFDF777|nr:branched-chain amino acid ABC transporter permease [Polynucleobacter sp. Adler-ghost]QWE30399.1 branched-chain amino acid ABC transporter permease [Polynucleobacter sp. Adler-ghost]
MRIPIVNKILTYLLLAILLAAPWIIPVIGDAFWMSILTEILIWSCFAASINFLFGYVGLLSFGQALYFGCGMYGVALGLTMLGLGFWGSFLLGVSSAGLMALITGALAVRLTWHYFAIITVVFSLIFYFIALTIKPITGGDDGVNFTAPELFKFGDLILTISNPTTQYFFILAVVTLLFFIFKRLVSSPLGKSLMAVRDNETRAALIGLNVYRLKLTAFVISGIFAGISGALFALFGRYASVSYMFYHVSGEGVVWAILGGAGTLAGPFVGTALFILIREVISSYWQHYALIVGAIAILVVIYAPKGIVGMWNQILLKKSGGDKK